MNDQPSYFYRLVREEQIVRLYRHDMDEPMGSFTLIDSSGIITASNDSGLRALIQDVRLRSQEEPDVWRGYYDTDGYWRIKGPNGTAPVAEGPVGKMFPGARLQTPNEYRASQAAADAAPEQTAEQRLEEVSAHLIDVRDMLEKRLTAITEVLHHARRLQRYSPKVYEVMIQTILDETLAEAGHMLPKAAE